jgi:hypothetical protein
MSTNKGKARLFIEGKAWSYFVMAKRFSSFRLMPCQSHRDKYIIWKKDFVHTEMSKKMEKKKRMKLRYFHT